jgi:2-polyprenyl-3-methyl-5-hydroxy-6-metoxy-1,4-benzoquinol methylase
MDPPSTSDVPAAEDPSDHVLHNRRWWDGYSDEYETLHHDSHRRPELTWGVWDVPERELQILGDVAGKDVLELGCGAAQCSVRLATMGARPVGLDNSAQRLGWARRLMAEFGVSFPLVQANAERVPWPTRASTSCSATGGP